MKTGDFKAAYEVLDPISFRCLYRWGHYSLLIKLWEQLIGHITDFQTSTALLGHLAICYRVMGRFDRALELTEQALQIAQENGYLEWESAWLGNLGIIYLKKRDYSIAIPLLDQAAPSPGGPGVRTGNTMVN